MYIKFKMELKYIAWENVENGDGQSGNVVGKMWKMGMGNRGTWLVKCGKRGWATGERGWEIAGNVG